MNIKELALQRLNEYRAFVDTSNAIAGEKLGRVQDLLLALPDDERHAFGRQHGITFADSPQDPSIDESQES